MNLLKIFSKKPKVETKILSAKEAFRMSTTIDEEFVNRKFNKIRDVLNYSIIAESKNGKLSCNESFDIELRSVSEETRQNIINKILVAFTSCGYEIEYSLYCAFTVTWENYDLKENSQPGRYE